MAFRREDQLLAVARATPELREIIGAELWSQELVEPRGLFGVPDLVFATLDLNQGDWICSQTAALELKLRNWRRALVQAFRYRAFAHAAYVVLDADRAAPALANLAEFRRTNVGLLTIDASGKVTMLYRPKRSRPVCAKLSARLNRIVNQQINAT